MNVITTSNNFSQSLFTSSIRALIVAGFMLCVGNAFAQTLSIQAVSDIGTVQPAVADSIVQITAESQGLQAVPYADLPLFGTYWEVMPGNGMAPLPCPPFDPTLPIYAITDNIFLVDATYGQVVVNPRRTAMMSSSSATTFTLDAQATAVANLIEQVQTASASRQGRSLAMASGLSGPPGFGDGGGGDYTPDTVTNTPPNYGTNLWIAQTAIVSGYLTGIGTNTQADIQYEIQSRTNLMQTDWQSEGFINGSELTNWTPLSVVQGNRPILFLRLRSWIDSYNIGIPDWWQFQFFGTNGIDPDASAAGDGYSNLEKFEMGLNPTNYYNPNPLGGFFGYLDTTGTNAIILWNPAPGPVANYAIQRGIYNSLTGYTYSQIGLLSSNTTIFEDVGAITNANAQNNIYNLAAVYPGGSLSATDVWQVSWYANWGSYGPPYGPPIPTNIYAYVDITATNVFLSWASASGRATNYIIERGIYNLTSYTFNYFPIAHVNSNATSFEIVGAITNAANWSDRYGVVAVYPGNGLSSLAASSINIGFTNGLAAPNGFLGYTDSTGTNLFLSWSPAPGSPTNYIVLGGTHNSNMSGYHYVQLGKVSGNTTSFQVVGGMDIYGDILYDVFSVVAVYANGTMSQAAFWYSANGTPAPGAFVAYLDATGTNVLLSWKSLPGTITGYIIQRSDYDGSYFEFTTSSNATSFKDTNAVNTGAFDPNYTEYSIQATFPNGGLSSAASAMVSAVLPAPSGLSATVDSTGTNVLLTWIPAQGAAASYQIERGVLNPNTGVYTYTSIGTVGAGVASFEDVGAITSNNSYNNRYQIEAVYPGGETSQFDSSQLPGLPANGNSNYSITANLIRNGTGRWQVMFSGISTNIGQSIQFTWTDANYNTTQQTISTTSLTNGIYLITDASVVSLLGDSLSVQLFGANGVPGQIVQAGTITSDAPYFVDGRPHMKQNLIFLIRAAAINKPFGGTYYDLVIYFNFSDYFPRLNQTSTNFEEFSFLNHQENSSVSSYNWSMSLDNLWPFNANYYLANYFVDTTRTNFATGGTNFNFQINFASSIPAPAILSASPYYTLQPGFLSYFPSSINGEPPIHVTNYNCLQWGVTLQNMQTTASLASGSYNVFQLPYQTGIEVEGMADFFTNVVNFSYGVPLYYQSLSPGGSVTVQEQNYYIGAYASQTPAPILQAVNYFFAPLINPSGDSMGLPGEIDPNYSSNFQPFSMPIDDDFNVTNQTPPLIIGTVGKPMILGGWAKYSIKNGSTTTGKYAYLGQYFVTNAFLLNADGTPTTNSAGIVSPYGEFFPMQAGVAGLVTMQDIDSPYQQGTGVVKIVSMNVDANHDGKLDFSYSGPDQNSASRPFRFWVNDNTDEGDFGGNGIPGQGSQGDGVTQLSLGTVGWMIHGRRDLVDFFPVCLNIGSLFQSNALSAGISATDTNYQFVLSQADSVLRFAYTDLTPTNYMAFLQDTNESWNFAYAPLTTISNGGVALPPSFLSVIATSNQSIILVEAAAPTTQPLVLTIYHGTNQIAQTQLYLSITGVEQMFRSKTMLLNPQPDTVADRLTDASVPNEPDTINKNFVFLHGYNVLPDEARGVAADTFKRMYWSGSHAKFYAVTWEGADTKGSLPFRKLLTPNYHTNVVNAFGTAPFLASFIATLTNSGPVVVAAHSLGNMVVLSAISDWNTPISQYFMLDAAVPIEAIDPTATTNMMIYSTWTGYSNRLFASDWYQLFPTNDARSTLNWNNRLGNLQNVDVYNFYSSGEEVLRTSAGDPPTSVLNKVATQLTYNFWDGFPFGSFTWYWQEKGKGTCSQDWFLGSSHGGWKFNSYWVDSHGNTLSPTIMNGTTNSILQNQPMFNFNSTDNNFLLTVDSELLGAIYGVNPSTYAAANRNRILADAIPAMSLVAGANPVPRLKPQNGDDKNIDMMTLENGWSLGRTVPENNKWHHSDFVQMAYTFTYKLFNQFVTTGNLK